MKMKTFALAGAAGTLVAAGAAHADFLGVSIQEFVGDGWIDDSRPDDQNYGTMNLTTFRLYAEFDGVGDDGVLSAFGIDGVPATVQSSNGLFHNAVIDSLTAPQDLTFIGQWENQWDTYVTINATDTDGDATTTSPGFANETNDLASNWSSENVGWFVTPDDPQSMAVDNRVLLAQFSVANDADGGAEVFGIINLLLRDGNQPEGLTFSSATPAPGALALLGLAGLAGRRRRNR